MTVGLANGSVTRSSTSLTYISIDKIAQELFYLLLNSILLSTQSASCIPLGIDDIKHLLHYQLKANFSI